MLHIVANHGWGPEFSIGCGKRSYDEYKIILGLIVLQPLSKSGLCLGFRTTKH